MSLLQTIPRRANSTSHSSSYPGLAPRGTPVTLTQAGYSLIYIYILVIIEFFRITLSLTSKTGPVCLGRPDHGKNAPWDQWNAQILRACQEYYLGQTQNLLERLCLSAGSGITRCSLWMTWKRWTDWGKSGPLLRLLPLWRNLNKQYKWMDGTRWAESALKQSFLYCKMLNYNLN